MLESSQDQNRQAFSGSLHSANAGVVVEVVAQVRQGRGAEALRLLRDTAAYFVDEEFRERVSVLGFQEVGVPDRLRVLLHLSSMNDYDQLHALVAREGGLRQLFGGIAGGLPWDSLFVDGSIQSTIMLPQFRRMYGAADAVAEIKNGQPMKGLPPAYHQFTFPLGEIIHSGNAGLVIRRSAQLKYEFRSEGRQFAREVVDSINSKARGEATCFLFEEAFGAADRLHWLIHLKTIGSYYPLIQMHAVDPEVRDLYFRETLPASRGGGNWSRMFVEGSMVDRAYVPLAS